MRHADGIWSWLVAAVATHFVITLVHGAAHAAAHVGTTVLQNIFIWAVIEVGPLAGLWVASRFRELGGWLIAATMSASFAFGLINHFLLPGVDRVDHVSGPWSALFAVSAVALAITEIGGAFAGMVYATRRLESSS